VAQDHPGQRCLGGGQDQGHLPLGTVSTPARAAWSQEGNHRGAASMLTAAYHILRGSVPYKDLGPEHFNRRDKKHAARRLQCRLEDLGFSVEIRPTTAGVSI
jgi:hypothetical protein